MIAKTVTSNAAVAEDLRNEIAVLRGDGDRLKKEIDEIEKQRDALLRELALDPPPRRP